MFKRTRLSPFIETGEFANVGIVLMAPNQRYFASKLEIKRYGRITRFFEELDRKLYTHAIHVLKVEVCLFSWSPTFCKIWSNRVVSTKLCQICVFALNAIEPLLADKFNLFNNAIIRS